MPKPYSQDLRDRVIEAVERGEMSRRAAARRYDQRICGYQMA
jgi:transposase